MNNFVNDKQRKKVMSELNGKGVSSSSIQNGSSPTTSHSSSNLMLQDSSLKGVTPEFAEDLKYIDKLHTHNGILNNYDNGDSVILSSLVFNHDGIKIPEDELAKSNGDIQAYIDIALNGRHIDDMTWTDRKLTKAQRKEQERRWKVIIQNNEDHPKIQRMREIQNDVDDANKKIEEMYDKADSMWRGTSFDEIYEWHQNSGSLDSEGYNYYPVTLDPNVAGHTYSNGILIEFDGESIRKKDSTLVQYTADPIPLGLSKSVATSSNQGKKMSYRYIDELEVRVPEYSSIKHRRESPFEKDDVIAKRIFVDKETFDEHKYQLDNLQRFIDTEIIVVNKLHDIDFRKGNWNPISIDWDNL